VTVSVLLELREQPTGQQLAVEIRTHQQARSGGGSERRREREFGVVTPPEALVAPRPGEIEDELAVRVALDEGRGAGREPVRILERQIARLPAAARPEAARALERGEKLLARELILAGAERVPLLRGEVLDAVVKFGAVHWGGALSAAVLRSQGYRDNGRHRAPPCSPRPPR